MARIRKYTICRIWTWLYQKFFIIILLALLLAAALCLGISSRKHNEISDIERCQGNDDIYPIIDWGSATQDEEKGEWTVSNVEVNGNGFIDGEYSARVTFIGRPPFPVYGNMRAVAEECNVNNLDLELIPTYQYKNLLY